MAVWLYSPSVTLLLCLMAYISYRCVPHHRCTIQYHNFHPRPEQEFLEDGGNGNDETAALEQWVLPAKELSSLWETLILDTTIKNHMLEYASSAMLFADKGVSNHVIGINRVILLHGEPGTGKTSLCKALAHKLSIRLSDRYSSGQLLEINAHSLFSKWFSESGKLVAKLFEHITELADDEECLLCILIDEVESLTAARSAAMRGNEPSDAVRVVNAVLTQIDNLRARTNVLVLTTSNITGAIDLAFVDRADLKQHIGLPPCKARYMILASCLEELMRVGIIAPAVAIPCFAKAEPELKLALEPDASTGTSTFAAGAASPVDDGSEMELCSTPQRGKANGTSKGGVCFALARIASKSEGLSGRALRKLPFQAHAFFVQQPCCTLLEFLAALDQAVMKEQSCREDLRKEHI
ncbi:unnamed protein product [Chrysoparadoxa australica]